MIIALVCIQPLLPNGNRIFLRNKKPGSFLRQFRAGAVVGKHYHQFVARRSFHDLCADDIHAVSRFSRKAFRAQKIIPPQPASVIRFKSPRFPFMRVVRCNRVGIAINRIQRFQIVEPIQVVVRHRIARSINLKFSSPDCIVLLPEQFAITGIGKRINPGKKFHSHCGGVFHAFMPLQRRRRAEQDGAGAGIGCCRI